MSSSTIKSLVKLVKPDNDDADLPEDQKWVEVTVKQLAKRIGSNSTLEILEKAIRNEERQSPCCIIKRSSEKKTGLDKGATHFLACRIWRFPWLRSLKDLRAQTSVCRYPYKKKADHFCINPFHYEPARPPALPPIAVETGRFDPAVNLPSLLNRQTDCIPNEVIDLENSMDYSPSLDAHGPSSVLSDDMDMDDVEEDDDVTSFPLPQPSRPGAVVELVPYEEPASWISVKYYEKDIRVGPALHVSRSYLWIDGSTFPTTPERLALGYLKNAHRSAEVKMSRNKIKRGIRIYYIGGEVYLENLSENGVFIQAESCNERLGFHPATVAKIPPRCNLKIWNNAEFAQQMAHCVQEGYEAVYNLTHLCTLRISLLKGWGTDYHRQAVTSTPCWMEAHLNGPLQWIDRVLIKMGSPPGACGSVS